MRSVDVLVPKMPDQWPSACPQTSFAVPTWARQRGTWAVTFVVLLLLAGELIIGMVALLQIEHEIAQVTFNDQRKARDTAHLLSESVRRVVDQVSALLALGSVVSHPNNVDSPLAMRSAHLEIDQLRNVTLGDVAQIAAIRADGYLMWSNLVDTGTPVYLGDREHFRAIVERRSLLYISEPLLGRVSKRYTIQFARGAYDTDDTVTAVIVVSLDPAALIPEGIVTAAGKNVTLSVIRVDGPILALIPPVSQPIIADANIDHLKAMIADETTLFAGTNRGDNKQRWFAATLVPGTNLFVSVGIDIEESIARVQPVVRAIRIAWIFAGLLLIGLFTGGAILHAVRKQAIEARLHAMLLTDADSLFRKIAEELPDGVHLTNSNFEIIFTNPAGAEMLGLKEDGRQSTGSTDTMHLVSTLIINSAKELRNAPAGTKASRLHSVSVPDRTRKWYEIRVHVLTQRSADPSMPFIVTSTRDVTKLVEGDSYLLEARHDMMNILLATGSIIFRYKMFGNLFPILQFVSDSAFLVTGYKPSQFVNEVRWMLSRLHPEDADEFRRHDARLRHEGQSFVKFRFKHKKGHWIWMQCSVERKVIDGKTVFLAFARDISSEHLMDMQIAQSAKLAMLGEMTTGMAHELKQPLATISMAAENVMTMLDDEQLVTSGIRLKLERIVAQVGRAAKIIDNMRVFGRIREEAHASLYISEQIDSVLDILANKLRHMSIMVTRNGDIGEIAVLGDAVAFQQLLMNLVGNAIDAVAYASTPLIGEQRTIRIDIGLVSGQVRFAITDRAGGVSDEVRARMFEPFFTTKPPGLGTGLGLSISFGIVKEMGGRIAAANVQDGLEVEILLPVANSKHGQGSSTLSTDAPLNPSLAVSTQSVTAQVGPANEVCGVKQRANLSRFRG